MKELWFWISREFVELGLIIAGVLVVLAYYGIVDLISKIKRRKRARKKGSAE